MFASIMEKCNMTGEESGLWLQCNAVFENVIWKMQNKEKYKTARGLGGRGAGSLVAMQCKAEKCLRYSHAL